MVAAPPLSHLDSDYAPASGALTLRLRNDSTRALSGFQLGLTGMFRIDAEADVDGGRLVSQLAHHQALAPPAGFVLTPGASWTVTARTTDPNGGVLQHYSFGPQSAYLVLDDGTLESIAVSPMTRDGAAGAPLRARPTETALPAGEAPVSIIPQPRSMQVAGARKATGALALSEGPGEARSAFAAVRQLAARMFGGAEPLFADVGTSCIARYEAMDAEAYRVVFAADAITVFAGGRIGFFYAFVTLGQMLQGARARPSEFVLPLSGEISDGPRFGWRGALLDVSRHVFQIDAVHRFVDVAAWHKLNRVHLHLSDDEGWRLEIAAYPQLTEIGGWRGHGLPLPPMFGSPGRRTGAVYTQADVSLLVERAAALGITIVPEIDTPGHSYATLRALPSLKDPGETGEYYGVHHYPNNALNPAVDATYAFLESVFGTVADLFPSPLIHIGGDEVARGAWLGSPQARALMQRHGWTETAQLQSHFLKRVQKIIVNLGRKAGAWQEAAHGGGIDAADAMLFAWISSESGLALAKSGYDVILMPGTHYYLDMAQSEDWWEPGASWAGTSPVDRSYGYDPGNDWPDELKPRLKGIECALWGEPLGQEPGLIDHLLFPRLSAVAETAWTPAARKNFKRFQAIQDLIPRTGL